jgi:PhzF family phenazine biosynthesis protein
MSRQPFHQVDVFTATPYLGNPLAVVHSAQGLDEATMQRFARWTNLSETTFLLPPSIDAAAAGADYQVRIFTPAYEMPFAGHPTLGSCHAWLEAGGVPRDPHCIVQQCKVGLVKIRRSEAPGGQRLAFAAPPLSRTVPQAAHRNALAQALGLQPHQIVDAQQLHNGPRQFGFLVDSVDTVLSVQPDPYAMTQALQDAGVTGVGLAAVQPAGWSVAASVAVQVDAQEAPTGPVLVARSNREARAFGAVAARQFTHPGNDMRSSDMPTHAPTGDEQPSVEIRFFAMHPALVEDPVTGSFNASMAQWLMAEGYAPARYLAAQGSCIGIAGRVFAERDDGGQVWIGGDTVTCIRGEVLL